MAEEEGYSNGASASTTSNKRRKISPDTDIDTDTDALIDSKFALLDELPDDLVVNIVSKLGATASCPADFFNLRLTCKRLNKLGVDRMVLSKLSPQAFSFRAKYWPRETHLFLRSLFLSMNLEAFYKLGMILFYIHKKIKMGKSMIAHAASENHAAAMHAMAIIYLNGSGGTKNDRNVHLALKYLTNAALLGHADAIRELGYRVKDGFIINKDVEEGRRLLLQATAREIVSNLIYDDVNGGWDRNSVPVPTSPWLANGRWVTSVPCGPNSSGPVPESELTMMSDFGWGAPNTVPDPMNRFLVEWFELRGVPGSGLRLCSRDMCGRPETRKDEFFRCPLCGGPCYCSRACQSTDWKQRHHLDCIGNNAEFNDDNDNDNDDDDGDEENEEDIVADEIQEEEEASEADIEV